MAISVKEKIIDEIAKKFCTKCKFHIIWDDGRTICNLSLHDFCQLCCCNNHCKKYDPSTSPCYYTRVVFLCIYIDPERTCACKEGNERGV